MTLTPEKLDEIERLAGLATPGPYSCVNGETITLRAPDGSRLAQMTFLTKRGRRDADEVAKTARMLAALDPATVRELVRAAKERDHQAARIAALEQRLAVVRASCQGMRNGAKGIHSDAVRTLVNDLASNVEEAAGDEA